MHATNEKADSTQRSSQAVPHPSTNRALCRLTSEVRRDPVFSATVWPSAKVMFRKNYAEKLHKPKPVGRKLKTSSLRIKIRLLGRMELVPQPA